MNPSHAIHHPVPRDYAPIPSQQQTTSVTNGLIRSKDGDTIASCTQDPLYQSIQTPFPNRRIQATLRSNEFTDKEMTFIRTTLHQLMSHGFP